MLVSQVCPQLCQHCVQDVWPEVLRCVSRFELLQQMELGGLSDAAIFANPAAPAAVTKVKRGFLGRSLTTLSTPAGAVNMMSPSVNPG